MFNNKYGECIRCNLCGGESGTLKIITQHINVLFKEPYGPFTFGSIQNNSNIDTEVI